MNIKRMNVRLLGMSLIVLASLVLSACQPAGDMPADQPENAYLNAPTPNPSVKVNPEVIVSDQALENGKVSIEQVSSTGPGWLVVHAQADGKPGAVLGYTQVSAGVTNNVIVPVDVSQATQVLYAMLHIDSGEIGVYEFPGVDGPAKYIEKVISPSFKVTSELSLESSGKEDYGYDISSTSSVPVTGSGVEIKVTTKEGLGTFLVDEKGMTLYLFTKDTPGVSNCSGSCLTAWPPLLTSGEPRAGDGVTGKLGTITRDDGSLQVTYNDMPLYYYVTDVKPGDTTGQDVGGVWFVVAP